MSDDIPDNIKSYLVELAYQLWSNKSSVLIGSGFSKNAIPNDSSVLFPNWKELSDIFFEKLYNRTPNIDERYLNPLKLAEQVEVAFGRSVLNELLKKEIPDLSYEPSSLHSQLLGLPWKDVFTTNYDTLIERSSSSVPYKKYDVVRTKDDLLLTKAPRIVKLHGSFPSPPFIITEEDYRQYPEKNAPFVNTIRQSLLESTLCLIGFSGDDPNFLQWIGWIRDHIGKNKSSKIYLVGVLNTLHEAEKILLSNREIVTVDLSNWSKNHFKAMECFLTHLEKSKPKALNWPD